MARAKHLLPATVLLAVMGISYTLLVLADEKAPASKPGFNTSAGFGGPNSVAGQLEEDDEVKTPALRFPAIDQTLSPWFEWKKRIQQDYGLQFGLDYNMLYQGTTDTPTDNPRNLS